MQKVEKDIIKKLHGKKKLQHLWEYYKFPFVVCCVFLYIVGYIIYGQLSKQNVVLYTALVNVSVSDTLNKQLNDGFIGYLQLDKNKNSCHLYQNLCLTAYPDSSSYDYIYASKVKVLAAIDNEQLDVVLMNKEAFDYFSRNGYLCDLENFLKKEDYQLYNLLKDMLVKNTVTQNTEMQSTGIDLSYLPLFSEAGFSDKVYLGVIGNSTRKDPILSYLYYLLE